MVIPLVPRKAMSTRSDDRSLTTCGPTHAWVSPRTRPPSTCNATDGMPARRAAMGTELVTIRSSRSAGNSAANCAVVVPASSAALEPERGR